MRGRGGRGRGDSGLVVYMGLGIGTSGKSHEGEGCGSNNDEDDDEDDDDLSTRVWDRASGCIMPCHVVSCRVVARQRVIGNAMGERRWDLRTESRNYLRERGVAVAVQKPKDGGDSRHTGTTSCLTSHHLPPSPVAAPLPARLTISLSCFGSVRVRFGRSFFVLRRSCGARASSPARQLSEASEPVDQPPSQQDSQTATLGSS